MTFRARFCVGLVVLLATAGTASAQLSWTTEVVAGEPTAQQKNPPPSIRVKITGEVLPAQDVWSTFVLKQVDTKMPGTKPIRAIPYHKSSETVGIVVVVEGHEYYFGNDKYRVGNDCKPKPDDPPRPAGSGPCKVVKQSAGVYNIIKNTLETPGAKDEEVPTTISRAGPSGSKGALVIYAAGAEKKFEGDLKNFNAEKLGDQSAQQGKTSRDLIEGLRMATDILKKIGTNRKALFVISDGFDAGTAEEMKAIRKRLEDDKVEVSAFYLEAGSEFIQDDATNITKNKANMTTLGGGTRITVKDQAALAGAITEAITRINSRYTLVFPGQSIDAKTKIKAGFTWDEKEHEMKLTRGEEEIANSKKDGEAIPMLLTLAPKWGQSAGGGGLWWLWIVIPGAVLLLGVIIAASGKKPAPAPPPMVVAPMAAPAPAPVMSAPPNPAKTMMVNISTGDGLPVVGWIVPISGEKQFQTFKLQYGETRVGTTSNSHIVLNDGFMSTDHAKVVMSPTGFTLMDNNSTNGTFANERRIQRHELVDNDMIMFGKTLCKFKTILGT